MRILADLPDEDIKWLDAYAAEQGKSRAAVMRDAISLYRVRQRDWLDQGFGLWTRYGAGTDGSEFEAEIRKSWETSDGEEIR